MPPTFRTLGRAWDEFRAECLPHDAPVFQIEECRQVFFAGAFAAFTILHSGVAAAPDDNAAAKVIAGMRAELDDFAAQTMNQGKPAKWCD